MRHRKRTFKIGRTASHRRCLMANMLKSLIENETLITTVRKAKELRRHADRMITLAKDGSLASRRRAIAEMMISFNHLSPQEARDAKAGDLSAYNTDRKVVTKLFSDLAGRFSERAGGYTRIVKIGARRGDSAPMCMIAYL